MVCMPCGIGSLCAYKARASLGPAVSAIICTREGKCIFDALLAATPAEAPLSGVTAVKQVQLDAIDG